MHTRQMHRRDIESDLSDAAVRIVPMFETANEADDQRTSRRHWPWRL
jgi:hypothetical protein